MHQLGEDGRFLIYRNTNTGKKINEQEAIPPPLRSRGVFIVGFPPTMCVRVFDQLAVVVAFSPGLVYF